jgi:hypothetical protein
MHAVPPSCPPTRAGCSASVFALLQPPAALSGSAIGPHSHHGDLNKVRRS